MTVSTAWLETTICTGMMATMLLKAVMEGTMYMAA